MPITNAQAQAQYLEGRDALSAIIQSRTATMAEKDLARRGRDRLDREFIGQQLADITARTAQFVEFVDQMNSVVDRLENNSLLKAVAKARGVTEQASQLLGHGG